jgi:hypothetical protein
MSSSAFLGEERAEVRVAVVELREVRGVPTSTTFTSSGIGSIRKAGSSVPSI